MTNGFIKLNRSEQTRELLKHPKAFTLLTVIACRGRRTNGAANIHDVKIGEALLGDHKEYGMTEQEYRTCKAKLKQWNLATFRGTNKGTIAKLTDNSIYDINAEPGNDQNNERSNGQATTNKNEKKYHSKKTSSIERDIEGLTARERFLKENTR